MIAATELLLIGQVQGHGVRPAIARVAILFGLAGEVRNTLEGLSVILEGEPAAIEDCCKAITKQLPEGTDLKGTVRREIPLADRQGFQILPDENSGPVVTPVPPDIGVCSECLTEVGCAKNRRYRYPLTTCATCGPRWSVIRLMPYERLQTTLADFPLCDACQLEYSSPDDRRFHAQTVGCSGCGPNIWGVDQVGHNVGSDLVAIESAASELRAGNIVALRGIGGYQLLCDATNSEAVTRLRKRKGRAAKPFAVLVANIDIAEQLAVLSPVERQELQSRANPIVLCPARSWRTMPPTLLASSVHPGLCDIGILLPSSPLHAMLAESFGKPLVCTSGNREGDPLISEVDEAERELSGIADFWLHHNRPIVRSIDDSVVRVIAERPVTIRLARGLAPLALDVTSHAPLLALGGHQKVACAWSNGSQSALGPHLGDMDTLASRDRFVQHVADIKQLYRFDPAAVTCDEHPGYFTSQWAAQNAMALPLQHHLAHVAAGMLEQGLLDREVLGVAWDGTGYGTDGSIWGGEFLRVTADFAVQRVAYLRPFRLLGSELAIREPWRVALALLVDAVGPDIDLNPIFPDVDRRTVEFVRSLTSRLGNHPVSTSAGRLFDAAAAITLSISAGGFEGHPAMLLESIADRSVSEEYPPAVSNTSLLQLDWRPLMAALWEDRLQGVSPAVMSMKFHRTLARGIVRVARQFNGLPVVLCGGVFQNRILTELVVELGYGLDVKLPGRIPPNDGGLAAGQLAVALKRQRTRKE